MEYIPKPGSNIAFLYELIMRRPLTLDELHNELKKEYPSIPLNGIHVHTKFLGKKGLIEIKDGYFRGISSEQKNLSEQPISKKTLEFLKGKIGKKITANEARKNVVPDNPRNSGPATAVRNLADTGYLQEIPGTNPIQFLVLPEIKTIDRVKVTAKGINTKALAVESPRINKQNDIANLSIGEILSEFVNLKQENTMLREALQRIAHELQKVGEVE